jgi:hypothetical protein
VSGQITVSGAVALGGSLVVTSRPDVRSAQRIIDHGGSGSVTGQFTGLPEGALMTANGQRFRISYAAGTGNDVVLTVDPPATVVWDGGPTGKGTDWFDPVNWSGDFLPVNGDDVVIGPLAGGPPVVIVTGGSATAGSVKVDGATLRLVGAGLSLGAGPFGGGNVTNSGIIELVGARLVVGWAPYLADLVGNITNSGTIELTSSASAGSGLSAGSITNAPGGVITTLPGGPFGQSVSGNTGNGGTITIGTDTTWGINNGFSNAGTIDVTGGNLTVGFLVSSFGNGTFVNNGAVTVAAGRVFSVARSSYSQSAGTTTVAGVLEVLSSSFPPNPYPNMFRQTGGTTTVTGTLRSPGMELRGGVLAGTGTVDAALEQYGGTISPGGAAAGALTTTSRLTQVGGTLAVDVNGPTAGTQYDQLKVNGSLQLAGSLVVNVGFTAAVGDTFRIIDNVNASSPPSGTFIGLPEGATLTAGGQDIRVSYRGGTGDDVTLTRLAPVLPRVNSVRVNDGAVQRSRVTSLTITFNTAVTFAGPAADAFALTRNSDGAAVAFSATTDSVGATIVTLGTFTGPAADAGSLADGSYTLTVRADRVSTPAGALDGNGDGTPGDDFTFGAAQGLRRLYGDATGDGWVDAADLTQFRQTFGRVAGDPLYLSYLDANADGANNGIELTRFRQAYNVIPRVSAIQVDDGSPQRSRIASLTVTFSTAVTFVGAPAAAFGLTREDGTPVTFAATVSMAGDATRVTLDGFAGPATEFGSLADGRYTLKVLASQVSTPGGALDGNADGTPGDDYSFGAAQGLVRKYGDGNGDGKVDAADLALFRQTFGRVAGDPPYQSGFDVNGDGAINGIDLARFRQAYGGGG